MCARFTLHRRLNLVMKELAEMLPVGLFDFDPEPAAALLNRTPTEERVAMARDSNSRSEFVGRRRAIVAGAILALFALRAQAQPKPRFLPEEAREIVGVLGINNSLVELKDGSLLSNDGRLSKDGGRTWTAPRPFGTGVAGAGIMRLASGALALVSQVGYADGRMWLSRRRGQDLGTGRPHQGARRPRL